jgi:hypothetical protein
LPTATRRGAEPDGTHQRTGCEGGAARRRGFGAVFKLYSRDNNGEVAIVEHPFAVGAITAPHCHRREEEHSIALDG